jgi:hypothetical protein
VTWDPFHYVLIAERQLAASRLAQAGLSLDGAHGAAQRDLRLWLAESHRVRGQWWLAAHADTERAERSFRDALEVARDQRTRSFELRAATSLARLWQQQDRRATARDLLRRAHCLRNSVTARPWSIGPDWTVPNRMGGAGRTEPRVETLKLLILADAFV